MHERLRKRFDRLVDRVIADLPPALQRLIEHVPVIVIDRPTRQMLRELGCPPDDDGRDICGLHSGPMITERSVEDPVEAPEQVHLFREGIVMTAGGWDQPDADEAIAREIRITLLHELGHHHGLDEDDLADLGYD